jgi:hypothetical protein
VTGRLEIAAALGVAFGVILDKALPPGWPLWQEAIVVAVVCASVYVVLGILVRGSEERGRSL